MITINSAALPPYETRMNLTCSEFTLSFRKCSNKCFKNGQNQYSLKFILHDLTSIIASSLRATVFQWGRTVIHVRIVADIDSRERKWRLLICTYITQVWRCVSFAYVRSVFKFGRSQAGRTGESMGQFLSRYCQQCLPIFSTCTKMLMVRVLCLLLALSCRSAILRPNGNLHEQAQDTQCSELHVVIVACRREG